MNKQLKHNSIYVKLVFSLLFIVLIAQLFRIQVIEHDKWGTRSKERDEFSRTYNASRGQVYFADGSPIAINELSYGVYAFPDNFDAKAVRDAKVTRDTFAKAAQEVFGLKEEDVIKKLTDSKIKYVSIINRVSAERLQEFSEKISKKLEVWNSEKQIKRVYPNKHIAAKLIGFLGKNESGEDIGRYGIEEYFDGVLRGTEGILEGKKDNKNRIIANEEYESITSKNGVDITLTIDKSIQAMMEERMMFWLDKYKAKEAVALVMEPNTGRILASVNLPTYDPNVYWKGELIDCKFEYYKVLHKECNKDLVPTPSQGNPDKNNEEVYYPEGYEEKLKELEEEKKKLLEQMNQENDIKLGDLTQEEKERLEKYPETVRPILRKESLPPAEVYRNAANSYLYEPGSVLKVLTLAIAYQYNAIPYDSNFPLGGHQGCEKVADVTLCTAKKQPRAQLTVKDMLRESDNIGALRVAQKVPRQDYVNTLFKFGLGKKSGVELADEVAFSTKETGSWSVVDLSTASYGQGTTSFTPIQLTRAWNILASDGKDYKPLILKSVNDNGDNKSIEPTMEGEVISAKAAKEALRVNALANSEATMRLAREFYAKYPYSGKTGTADIPDPDGLGYLSQVVNTSFIGVAPVENPRFTMLVWFREPRIGSDRDSPNGANTAQTAWIDIAEKLMLKMNIAPQTK